MKYNSRMNSRKGINATARAAGGFVVWMAMTAFPCDAAFTNRTAQLGLSLHLHQASWGDYNNDGYPDINSAGVWRNQAGTNFSLGSDFGYSVWGDYNNDGYLDLFSFSGAVQRNVSGAAFVTETVPTLPGTDVRGACWLDLDNDTFLDVYVGAYEAGGYQPDSIVSNDLGTNFVISWQEPLVAPDNLVFPGRGVTACDFDEDGDMDVYVSNYRLEANYLWLNNGSGGLTNVAGTYGVAGIKSTVNRFSYGHTIGSAWGDMNNDGHIDLFAGNFSHAPALQDRARFYENDGPANYHFTERTVFDGTDWVESYSSAALGDYDNDGDLDLFFSAFGSPNANDESRLYRNDGAWAFVDVTAAEGLLAASPGDKLNGYQAAWADYDNDGDLDLVTDGKLFENQGNANHWLKVHLEGNAITVNRTAIGAQVRIDLGGGTILTRQVEGSTGEGNQNDLTLHFGLGTRTAPVDLEIVWPGGLTQVVVNVAVDGLAQLQAGPLVDNGQGATGVTHNAAWLTGNLLSSGNQDIDVCVFYGPTTNWTGSTCLDDVPEGPFSILVSNLPPNTPYFYQAYASNLLGEAWASAPESFTTAGTIPFSETFDDRSSGSIHFQNGWDSAPPEAATVQTTEVFAGTKAGRVSRGNLSHRFSGTGSSTTIWFDCYAKFSPRNFAGSSLESCPNATAVLFVSADTGYVNVFDGTNRVELVQTPQVSTSEWVRYSVRSDYGTKTWALWLNETNAALNLGFYNSDSDDFTELKFIEALTSATTSVIDNVSISFLAPEYIPFKDDDFDNLDDDWEIFYFGSITNTAGGTEEDWDLDGFIDLHEFLAGTIPTNPGSILAVVDADGEAGDEIVLKWNSVSGKTYAIQHVMDLEGTWTSVVNNIDATEPLNCATVTVEFTPAYYRVLLE